MGVQVPQRPPSARGSCTKRRPCLARSGLLVVNKTDLAPRVGVDLALLEADAKAARGQRPFVMAAVRNGRGVAAVIALLEREGGLQLAAPQAVSD